MGRARDAQLENIQSTGADPKHERHSPARACPWRRAPDFRTTLARSNLSANTKMEPSSAAQMQVTTARPIW